MSGEERRGKIIQALKNSDKAVSATTLAKEFDVSRQVIVQDVAPVSYTHLDVYKRQALSGMSMVWIL